MCFIQQFVRHILKLIFWIIFFFSEFQVIEMFGMLFETPVSLDCTGSTTSIATKNPPGTPRRSTRTPWSLRPRRTRNAGSLLFDFIIVFSSPNTPPLLVSKTKFIYFLFSSFLQGPPFVYSRLTRRFSR